MKKSEMRNLIAEKLRETLGLRPDIQDISQGILNLIEKNGMLPPMNYPYSCGCSMRDQCPACNPNEYKIYNTWEQE